MLWLDAFLTDREGRGDIPIMMTKMDNGLNNNVGDDNDHFGVDDDDDNEAKNHNDDDTCGFILWTCRMQRTT